MLKSIRLVSAIVLVLALALALVAGCSSQPRKPTQDVVMTERAVASLRSLVKAYTSRRLSDMEEYCSAEAFASIASSMKTFASVELEVTPLVVEISEESVITIHAMWSGKWKAGAQEEEVALSDRAAFVFAPGHPGKLLAIKGSSPFAAP